MQNDAELEKAVTSFGVYIKAEVLGNDIAFAEKVDGVELVFDAVNSALAISKS